MGVKSYFFDTYALIEILLGNKNYEPYKKNVGTVVTKLNLMELYYFALRSYNEEIANKQFERFLPFVVDFDDEIKEACYFKINHKKKKLSFADCLGYVIAKKKRIKFLTGDAQFEGFSNVEYVK